jgi:hypothetical protein
MKPEPSDPVERADERREAVGSGDVTENPNGTINQKEHGSMDASLVPKGKDHPEQGAYVPEHDHVDPDLVFRVENSLNDADRVLKCSVWHLIRGGNDERTAQRRARAERIGA